MRRVFINEWKMAINISAVIAIIGVMFCICFDSWNDLTGAIQSGNIVWRVYYFTSNSAFGGMCRKYILPVFAVLPFATSFCEERNSRAVHSPVRYCMMEAALGFIFYPFIFLSLPPRYVILHAKRILLTVSAL